MAIPILVDIFGHPPFSGYNEEGLQQAQLYNSCVQEVKTKFIIGRFWPGKFFQENLFQRRWINFMILPWE